MAKKYYWLKLKKDFFKDKKMKKLRKIAGGEIYTLIYLKLQLLTIDNDGVIEYEGIEETLAEELELDIDEEKEHIEATLFLLEKMGLAEIKDNKDIFLPQVLESTGKESSSAERVRKHRINKKKEQELLQCNVTVTESNTEKEKELDIESDKDIELEDKFEYFWETYNKKINRKKCYNKFKKLPKKDIDKIIQTVNKFVSSIKDKQFLPYPYTYLNQERWNDEIATEEIKQEPKKEKKKLKYVEEDWRDKLWT